MAHVFISYARDKSSGQRAAKTIYDRLRDAGIDAFLDTERIEPGERWLQVINENLVESRIVLAVISEAVHDRPWVGKEYLQASAKNILVIPVLVEKDVDLPLWAADLQAADLTGDDRDSQWQRLLRRIQGLLATDAASQKRYRENVYLQDLLGQKPLPDIQRLYVELAGRHRREGTPARFLPGPLMPASFRHYRRPPEEPGEGWSEPTPYEDILQAFTQHDRLVILGEPGAGKTFSLWRILAERAADAQQHPEQPLPLVLPLNLWTEAALGLEDFARQQLGPLADEFGRLKSERRLILLMDALNEIPVDQREAKLPQVRAWIADQDFPRFAITCRLRDYTGPLSLDLDRLTIEPLDPLRIHTFAGRYFTLLDNRTGGETAETFFWQLAGGEAVRDAWRAWQKAGADLPLFWQADDIPRANPNVYRQTTGKQDEIWRACRQDPRSLMKLAANPYLLNLMVFIYTERGLSLPSSRVELFGRFVDDLILRETEDKNRQTAVQASDARSAAPDRDTLLERLRRLAWQLQSQSGGADESRTSLPRTDAEKTLSPTELEFAAAANLLDLSHKHVRFSHQLLQEYFTVRELLRRIEKETLKASHLWPADRWWQPCGWEETARLTAEYAPDKTRFVAWLAPAQPRLAVEIARDCGLNPGKLFSKHFPAWRKAIVDPARHPAPPERLALADALAWCSGDARPGVGLNPDGLPDIAWVEIHGGEFIYGKGEERETLTLNTFYISRYPVTNAQFQAFVDGGGYEDSHWWQDLEKPEPAEHRWKAANRPRESVSWYEAVAYTRWLSELLGYDVRLPTEQEWEKAARGIDGREYPWGDKYRAGFANVNEKEAKDGPWYLRETCAVGLYPQGASPYGVQDMAGNVWEWCLNKYDNPEDTTIDSSGNTRVLRGGSWVFLPGRAHSAFRGRGRPDDRDDNGGFRVVCAFPSPDQ